jgi:hypothetical protein
MQAKPFMSSPQRMINKGCITKTIASTSQVIRFASRQDRRDLGRSPTVQAAFHRSDSVHSGM